tara:strand:- start:3935 stop:4216 length:282 start_codon:yes stop_codon:yes gene_type:complete
MASIKATTITSTGTAVGNPARVKKLYYVLGNSAGSIVLKDGGSGGETILTLTTPAATTGEGVDSMTIPEDGMRFATDVHATLTNISSLTTFHG